MLDIVHPMDAPLFKGLTTTPEMREVFQADGLVQGWLDVEAALAEAQAEIGMIPAEAAKTIRAHAKVSEIDIAKVQEHGKKTIHTLMGVLTELRGNVGDPHQTWIHYGATTQDIIDSGAMLSFARAHAVLSTQFDTLVDVMLRMMETHRDTLMVARSHGNQALPFTFGLKVAGWLDEMDRNRDRWRELKTRCLVGNLSGAIGTHAAWGDQGLEVQSRACRILGLGVPRTWWHAQRDRLAEMLNVLSMTAGTATRIAQDIYISSMTEIGELVEAYTKDTIGSSTMPHKLNPIGSEWVRATAAIVRGNAATMNNLMAPISERDGGEWRAEWVVMPETLCLASAMLAHLTKVLSGLVVRSGRMRENVDLLKGVLLSERVMFVLSKAMPLGQAHEVMHELSLEALENHRPMLDLLLADKRVSSVCDPEELRSALNPENYTGLSGVIVDALARSVREEA